MHENILTADVSVISPSLYVNCMAVTDGTTSHVEQEEYESNGDSTPVLLCHFPVLPMDSNRRPLGTAALP